MDEVGVGEWGWTVAHPPIVAARALREDSASLARVSRSAVRRRHPAADLGHGAGAGRHGAQPMDRRTFSRSEAPGAASAIQGPSPEGSTMPCSSHS
ncbi:hypothetical protein GCM10010220_49870 [Streptomyces parvulus]|nr:hypothetical protein GCM10010220_49870 [Streptomyces parvulus]